MSIGRRGFLVLAGAAAVAGLALAVRARLDLIRWRLAFVTGRVSDSELRLRRHFSYLDIEASSIRQYIMDCEHRFGPLPAGESWPDDVYTRFLLSTDFFLNDGNETLPVSYLGLYDPPWTPCRNPFFRT